MSERRAVAGRGDRQEDALKQVRKRLASNLRARSPEIQEAIMRRIRAVAELADEDPEYAAGLRAAVAQALDYALVGIEQGANWTAPPPAAVIDQARRAARDGVGLDTVLRRYAAGDRLVRGLIIDEADQFPAAALHEVLSTMEPPVEDLMVSISSEYTQELERMAGRSTNAVVERVERLLARRTNETVEFDYEFEVWHLGVVAQDPCAASVVRRLADVLGCRLLLAPCDTGGIWAWLGRCRPVAIAEVERLASAANDWPTDLSLALGEPRSGLDGWRLTHHEAQAAGIVACRRPPQRLTRCADVTLEAALLRAGELARLLVETQLSPLDELRIGGDVARETLRAYFAAQRNVTVTAETLGVDRRTVWHRLSKVTEQLGGPDGMRYAELEIALRLEKLQDSASLK